MAVSLPSAPSLPTRTSIAYINADAATERRAWMQKQFAAYNSDVEVQRVATMEQALRQATEAAADHVILLQDRMVLFPGWIGAVREAIADAPSGWGALHLHERAPHVREQLARICEPFVRWPGERTNISIAVLAAGMPHAQLPEYMHTRNLFGDRAFDGRGGGTRPGPLGPPSSCAGAMEVWSSVLGGNVAWPHVLAFTVTQDAADAGFAARLERTTASCPRSFDFLVGSTAMTATKRHSRHGNRSVWHEPCPASRWACLAQRMDLLESGEDDLAPGGSLLAALWPWRARKPYRALLAFDDDLTFDAFPWSTLLARLSYGWPRVVGIPREGADLTLSSRDLYLTSAAGFWRDQSCVEGWWSGQEPAACKWAELHPPMKRHDVATVHFVEDGCTLIDTAFLAWCGTAPRREF